MKSQQSRIQPFRAKDGDHLLLLEFAKRTLPLVDIAFEQDLISQEPEKRSEPYDYDMTIYRYGDDDRGVVITYRIGYEPKYGGHAEDRVLLKALGLPEHMFYELECTRYYHDPRFIEIRLCLDEGVGTDIINLFNEEFGKTIVLTPKEIENAIASARAALVHRAWSSAEKHARLVLKSDPMNAYALFTVGVALAAQGDEPSGEEYLRRALEQDPTNYDIYYNLGLMHMLRGEYDSAIALYIRGLIHSEDNHALYYQLARAYEAAGKIEDAINAFQRAIDTSPNPSGAFHYTGMDFTDNAREALERLRGSIT